MTSSSHTKTIVADFNDSLRDESFFDKLLVQVQGLDISVLVNNVGVDAFERFHLVSEDQMK
jgi:17beta-estradiol 17-dehydrogenase / very-long-chain 3-oxoacyl-CoA reductase